jgi:signal transduction histidine kinase
MTFIVQDLLDYAQIKAGKFRKNITSFNIKESIEKVMCIQRNKAGEKNLEFNV